MGSVYRSTRRGGGEGNNPGSTIHGKLRTDDQPLMDRGSRGTQLTGFHHPSDFPEENLLPRCFKGAVKGGDRHSGWGDGFV